MKAFDLHVVISAFGNLVFLAFGHNFFVAEELHRATEYVTISWRTQFIMLLLKRELMELQVDRLTLLSQ